MLWGMKMTRITADDDTDLEMTLAAARAEPPEPGAAFRGRILALALAEQPLAARHDGSPDGDEAAVQGSFWRDAAQAIGGWWGAGGLTTAMACGLAIGLTGWFELPIVTQNEAPLELMPEGDGLFADADEEN